MRQVDARNQEALSAEISEEFGPHGRLWIPTKKRIKKFAQRTRDFTAQHVDATYASSLGFADVIAHGMLIAANLTRLRPGPGFELVGVQSAFGVEFHSRFVRAVVAGEHVHGRERLSFVEYKPRRVLLTHEFEVKNADKDDELVAKGYFIVGYYLTA